MAKKQSSSAASAIAARGLKAPSKLSTAEIKTLCASVLAQDETKGQRPKFWSNPIGYLTR